MKLKKLAYIAVAGFMGFSMTACSDFLDKPGEDSYNDGNYYDSDAACVAGVNYLYNSPWYDFERGFIKVGEVLSGNMYWGSSPYLNFSVNGTDQDLVNMSYSLWAVNAHCNTVYNNLASATNTSQATIDQCQGECLTWKAMAYFFLVRTFGDVPIIHDNSTTLTSGDYNTLQKVQKADVYDYICLTLEKAMELLPKTKSTTGRIDYYSAEGLLAKVYLTKAGVTGTLNNDDLQKAYSYAQDVIDNSGRQLMGNYEDIFRGSNNVSDESLIAWRGTVGSHWTCQNSFQSDLAPEGFDENGDCWGGWNGPSVDLMDCFGVSPTQDPEDRKLETDVRRKATIMMPGDFYTYFWRDHTVPSSSTTNAGRAGFDILNFWYNSDYNKSATGTWQGACGAQNVKNLWGDNADHIAEMGITPARQQAALATHLLRLSDVYLVLAEAAVLQGHGTDAKALECYNAVHNRATGWKDVEKTSLTFNDIWVERRKEFAGEGDRWYDFVRRAYYDPQSCINEIRNQRRNAWWGCDAAYKAYYRTGNWSTSGLTDDDGNAVNFSYDTTTAAPNVTANSFTLPFPTEDVTLNPNLSSNAEAIHVDVRSTYSY